MYVCTGRYIYWLLILVIIFQLQIFQLIFKNRSQFSGKIHTLFIYFLEHINYIYFDS